MKKISLILNGVLIVAVAVLYVLHFSSRNKTPDTSLSYYNNESASPVSAAYINLDTLLNNLDQYYDLRNNLMSKTQESQSTLDNNARNFEKSYMDLQDQVNKGLITRSNAMKKQEELKMEEQRILKLREELTYKLAEEEQVMNRNMMNEIVEFLKYYNKNRNYQMIISNVYGGTLLYANDSMNITKEVIDGLNAQYAEKKGKK